MTAQVRPLLVLVVAVAAALAAGLVLGRYAFPAPIGVEIPLPNGGAVRLPAEDVGKLLSEDEAGEVATTIRAAVPAIEVYFEEHATYSGASSTTLRELDHSIADTLRVVWATETSYCMQATVGDETAHMAGPDRGVAAGPCPA